MKKFDTEFKISHRRLDSHHSSYDLIYQTIQDFLEEADITLEGNVNIQVLHEPWDLDFQHFRVSGWYREAAVPVGHCHNCGQLIRTMIFKGCDWCSDDCRKALQRR